MVFFLQPGRSGIFLGASGGGGELRDIFRGIIFSFQRAASIVRLPCYDMIPGTGYVCTISAGLSVLAYEYLSTVPGMFEYRPAKSKHLRTYLVFGLSIRFLRVGPTSGHFPVSGFLSS